MMKHLITLLLGLILGLSGFSQDQSKITPKEILGHIEFLASDSLKGRGTGTPESFIAAGYIRDQFKSADLNLLGENGMQYFELVADIELGEKNSFTTGELKGKLGEDFTPLPFSSNGKIEAEVVFAGFGFEINNDSLKWNDYQNIDVKGKWVLILRGSPEAEKPTGKFDAFVDERYKVLTAKDKEAAGVIFVSGEKFDADDKLLKLSYDKSAANAGIPVLQIKRTLVEPIFAASGKSLVQVESDIITNQTSMSFSTGSTVSAQTDIIQKMVKTQNVIAFIQGSDPVLKDQYILIGAHYDHLGFGGPGSGSRMPDTVAPHYGADDNASGVAGVIELAEKLASEKNNLRRSIIFMAFGAEEMGLVGSKYFTENPLIPLNEIEAMINFDMIGRLKENNSITVGGTGTSSESEEILNILATKTKLVMKYSPEGYGPSDHAAFYTSNIPVFYFTTGAHEDYHTPFDKPEAINAEGETMLVELAGMLVTEIANRQDLLSYKEAGPKNQAKQGYNFKVTFGIMPDVTSSENNGLGVDGVRKGGPAEIGGVKKGDRIVAIDGKPVTNIYEYMGRLKTLEAGQRVSVDIIRDGKKEVLILQL
jgi:Iap family predicted aminopeptidase